MILSLSQLIKFRYRDSSCCLDTVYWAAGLCAAVISFCRAIWQLYRDPKLCAVYRDSSIYRDYPICQLYRDPKLAVVNRDYPISTALGGHRNFQPSTGILSGPKASSRLPGLCKNSCQRGPQSATQLNRRAVRRQCVSTREPVFVREFIMTIKFSMFL
jgi:hypothetical protein